MRYPPIVHHPLIRITPTNWKSHLLHLHSPSRWDRYQPQDRVAARFRYQDARSRVGQPRHAQRLPGSCGWTQFEEVD